MQRIEHSFNETYTRQRRDAEAKQAGGIRSQRKIDPRRAETGDTE
ncbi:MULTISPECIES: hypothetical protein [Burkholderia]|nr:MULTISPECIES: hypothetical protein [Burkholderia]